MTEYQGLIVGPENHGLDLRLNILKQWLKSSVGSHGIKNKMKKPSFIMRSNSWKWSALKKYGLHVRLMAFKFYSPLSVHHPLLQSIHPTYRALLIHTSWRNHVKPNHYNSTFLIQYLDKQCLIELSKHIHCIGMHLIELRPSLRHSFGSMPCIIPRHFGCILENKPASLLHQHAMCLVISTVIIVWLVLEIHIL